MPKKHDIRWFVVEEIPQNVPFVMGITRFMVQEWPKRGLGEGVKKYFTWFEKDLGRMVYIMKEFEKEADFLSQKMLRDPVWALKVLGDIEKWSSRFFEAARRFRNLRFAGFSNHQLISSFEKVLKWHTLSHGVGSSLSWHADANGERVSRGLLAIIQKRIKENLSKVSTAEVFTILSSPEKESGLKKEEKALLKLVIKKADSVDLCRHANKYEWLNYQYKGPAFPFSYFADRFGSLNPAKAKRLLSEIERRDQNTREQKRKLVKELNLNSQERSLVKMAQEMVFIKDYRKESLYHGMYCYEPFFREIARRFALSIDQVRTMHWWEIVSLLRSDRVDVDELNERMKQAVYFVSRDSYKIYTGARAGKFLSQIKWQYVKKRIGNEFHGSCAYPGKVRGRVKIINIPQDMSKMRKGDILVAHNTNPNLVPAMKIAKALVSGAGGLTCHTAIIARELRIPSVVGIPGIDKILKDGDKVEVDSNKGIVRRIKAGR